MLLFLKGFSSPEDTNGFRSDMDTFTLYEEYRLIGRNEDEINGAWSGAHLLLFFLAFVFGSFCTFCFHMLMYLFDEKCVLFPKLLSLTSLRHNAIYEFIPNNKDPQDYLPVDFLSTQWVEKSTCDLPTYVPLVSGIFGLVWTTMFLMCSTGSRTSGFHRPWRVLLPVFMFSLTMGILCIYSSTVTHYGLQELCHKLAEITGGSTCSYTVNAATLAYERSIRGVYQATRLTIITAWLHTACWILSAVLALVRVLMVIDFQLVKINVNLRGDIDKMLQQHEQQIRTVSPDPDSGNRDERLRISQSRNSIKVHFRSKTKQRLGKPKKNKNRLDKKSFDVLFFAGKKTDSSESSLLPQENKESKVNKSKRTAKSNIFIRSSTAFLKSIKSVMKRHRRETIKTKKDVASSSTQSESMLSKEDEDLATEISRLLYENLDTYISEGLFSNSSSSPLSSSRSTGVTEEIKIALKMMDRGAISPAIEKEAARLLHLKPVNAQMSMKENNEKISGSLNTSGTDSVSERSNGTHSTNIDKPKTSEMKVKDILNYPEDFEKYLDQTQINEQTGNIIKDYKANSDVIDKQNLDKIEFDEGKNIIGTSEFSKDMTELESNIVETNNVNVDPVNINASSDSSKQEIKTNNDVAENIDNKNEIRENNIYKENYDKGENNFKIDQNTTNEKTDENINHGNEGILNNITDLKDDSDDPPLADENVSSDADEDKPTVANKQIQTRPKEKQD